MKAILLVSLVCVLESSIAERRIFRNLWPQPVSPTYEQWTPSNEPAPSVTARRDFSTPPPGVPSNAVHLYTFSLFGSDASRYPNDPNYRGPISVSMFRTAQRYYQVHNYADGRAQVTVNPGSNGN